MNCSVRSFFIAFFIVITFMVMIVFIFMLFTFKYCLGMKNSILCRLEKLSVSNKLFQWKRLSATSDYTHMYYMSLNIIISSKAILAQSFFVQMFLLFLNSVGFYQKVEGHINTIAYSKMNIYYISKSRCRKKIWILERFLDEQRQSEQKNSNKSTVNV